MNDIEVLIQKYPFLYNLIRYKGDCIKILNLLSHQALDIEEISKRLNLKKYIVEEDLNYLENHNLVDKLYISNKVLYYPTSFGKKFIEAYNEKI